MRLLFDIKTTQKFVGGGSEYTRRIFFTLLKIINEKHLDVDIVGLVDSRIDKFAYVDMSPENLKRHNIPVADIAHSCLKDIISEHRIDKIFIGCGQTWNRYDLENVTVPVICVIHDLWNEEYTRNYLNDYMLLNKGLWNFVRHRVHLLFTKDDSMQRNRPVIEMIKRNTDSHLITVSNSSKYAIVYNYELPSETINVMYSPERISNSQPQIDNPVLRSLIKNSTKYYLMLSANRNNKNSVKAMKAFKRYVATVDANAYIATTGMKKQVFSNHVPLPFLSESDLVNAMRNCYALLFPSYYEGFGYPPVEAMSFGRPIVVSNTSSIPEVCGDAAIYFSPFFESDIFRALTELTDASYYSYQEKSLRRYEYISKKQQADLDKLINIILK